MLSRRLLFFAPSAYCLGGVQVWLSDLVAGLQDDPCWQVQVALPSGREHRLDRYREAYPQLPILPLLNPTGSAAGRRQAIFSLLQHYQPDLVVGVNIAELYPAVRRARRHGFQGRVVFSLHSLAADLLADVAAEADLLDAVIATNRLSCRLAECVGGIAAERVLYAPCGANWPSHADANPLVCACPPTGLRIAWVGRLEESQKRVQDLARILQHLEAAGISFHLTVAGDGSERKRLALALEPWTHAGVVTLAGALTGTQLSREVYASHQVLLITSFWERGPIVAWEAMAAGLVVVSSAYIGSGLEGALRDGDNALLFPVGDAAAAAAAIARLADLSLRRQLVAGGRQVVEQRYNAKASQQAWVRAFEQVLALPPRSKANPEPPISPSGRLDRLFGAVRAEWVRRRLGLGFRHTSPGGEWPHTAHGDTDEMALLNLAAEIDHHHA